MLIDVSFYKNSLKRLWAHTFGDNEEYISLLFDHGYTPAECFAEIIDEEVVSALYLLKGYICFKDSVFEGRYLYAAATAENYRKNGIMSKLIKEAQEYVSENNICFISLVPANEGLYGYYSKFGFEAILKNYVSFSEDIGINLSGENIFSEELLLLRKRLPKPYFTFAEKEWQYALSCMRYADYSLVRNSADSYYIISDDSSEILEYVSSEENLIENTNKLLSRLKVGTKIVSAYNLSSFCECKENKFGMVYISDNEMRNKISDDIYMNIALD